MTVLDHINTLIGAKQVRGAGIRLGCVLSFAAGRLAGLSTPGLSML
ncbi:hypothetical protein [Roseobacter sp.]